MTQRTIYLDYQATTAVDERVVEAMLPYFTERYGNPASKNHRIGWQAAAAVDGAREKIAALVGGEPASIIFTSGATEANNLAIKGAAEAYASRGRRIVTVATEHSSVLDPCAHLKSQGFEVIFLTVDPDGYIDLHALDAAMTDDTILVSVMIANNEIGTVQPMERIADLCRAKGVLLHSDATQAVGRVAVDAVASRVDLMSFSAHKIYGPKGIGALYVRPAPPRIRLAPILHGGGHEHGLRSGTLNVPAIVGFAAAADILVSRGEEERARLADQTERLLRGLTDGIPRIALNGPRRGRLPGSLNLRIGGIDADRMMSALRELAFSTGSACGSGIPGPSHVLRAIGLTGVEARESFRISIGRNTTDEEIAYVCTAFAAAARALE
jgi:cysteine desulfurase